MGTDVSLQADPGVAGPATGWLPRDAAWSDSRPAILLMGDSLDRGGTEGQFVEIATRLDRSKWNVHVSCLRAEGPLRARLEQAGVRAWSCGRGSLKSPSVLAAIWELARSLRRSRIRLVHSFDFYSNILGVLAARLARVPAVIASQRDLGDLRRWPDRRVHSIMLRLADRVLVNSQAVADRLTAHRALARRIVLVPNGVDFVRFSPPAGPTGGRSGGVTVGTLANLRAEKGLADFVEAAALVRERCPDVRFVVWGEGPQRPHLERLVAERGVGGAVELRGSTAEPEVELRKLDIFVLPSLSEACSNGLLEAMATGLPVVTTNVGGNASLVEDEVTGLLVPPGDSRSIAEAIVRLIQRPAFAAELAARGRDRLQATFGMDRMVARVEALYDGTLAGSGG